MSDLRKAAEMALDALNEVTGWQWGGPMRVMDEVEDAIQALRQALAQEQEPLGEEWVPCVKLPVVVHVRKQREGETHISTREGITPVLPDDLIMRGVAGEEYPIGRELFNSTYTFDTAPVHTIDISQERVDETAKSEHEPGLWVVQYKDRHEFVWGAKPVFRGGTVLGLKPLYTAPPHHANDVKKREWVGLTDEEMRSLKQKSIDDGMTRIVSDFEYIRAIEAKLKEKNA